MNRWIFFLAVLCNLSVINGAKGQTAGGAPTELAQLIMDRNYTEAIVKGNEGLASDSLNPQAYYYLGIAYSGLKQYEKACAAFEKSDRLQPGNKSVILNLADCYCEVADVAAAQVLIEDLLRQDSTDMTVWLELAQIYQRLSLTDRAVSVYERLWSQDSANIWYPRQLGMLMARNERYREAVPYLEKVVETDSSDQGSYLRLGQAYLYLKAYDKIPVLDQAIRQDSMQPVLHRYRGGLWLGAGIFNLAEDDLKTALELGDTTAFTCRHLGLSQFQLAKYEEALVAFEQTVRLDSLDTEAWYYLGYCYKWTENLPKAIECLTKALKIAIPPSTGDIYNGLGLFYNLQRDLKNAMRNYEKALEYNPGNAYPLSQMGLLVEQTTRDKEAAKRYYERFLKEYQGPDQHLVDYVRDRIRIINEKLFMEGKLTK